MTEPLYPKLDPRELEPHFSQHMQAMTSERLYSKADIAIQLAWRDKRIAELEALFARRTCERCTLDREGFGFQGMLPPHTCAPEDHI